MAPGVRKSFKKEFFKVLKNSNTDVYKKLKSEKIKKEVQQAFDEYLNYEVLDSKQFDENLLAFYNSIIDIGLVDKNTLSLKDLEFFVLRADEETDDQTYQAMESVIHNLNSMHSRAGEMSARDYRNVI